MLTTIKAFFDILVSGADIGLKIRQLFSRKKEEKPDTPKEEPEQELEVGYYFSETNKKVFIRKNGDGVIVCAFDLHVNDPTKVHSFVRTLDIGDAKSTTELPEFKKMCSAKNKEPFLNYIFWFQSEENIVMKTEEVYDKFSSIQLQNSKRYIRIKFDIDNGKLERGKTYRILYGYSIPGLFPIKNGTVDLDTLPCDKQDYRFSSSIGIQHLANKLRFAIYFERGIEISKTPMASLSEHASPTDSEAKKRKQMPCEFRDNLIYKKYLLCVDNPEKYDKILIEWDIKMKRRRGKGAHKNEEGGTRNEAVS